MHHNNAYKRIIESFEQFALPYWLSRCVVHNVNMYTLHELQRDLPLRTWLGFGSDSLWAHAYLNCSSWGICTEVDNLCYGCHVWGGSEVGVGLGCSGVSGTRTGADYCNIFKLGSVFLVWRNLFMKKFIHRILFVLHSGFGRVKCRNLHP